jgi:hypothetical protein
MKKIGIIILASFLQCSNPKTLMEGNVFPEIINKLLELQNKNEFDGEEFEFWIDFHDDFRYSICPIDAIPFASTGNNGIHFAFLTDFGRNKNLNEAPIICVAPSYDPPVNIVAQNIFEFLCIITTIENATLLADRYQNQEEFSQRINEWFEGFRLEKEVAEKRNKLANNLKVKFNLESIENIIEYTNEIRKDRLLKTDFDSMDGLGIYKINDEPIKIFDYSKKPEEVFKFLNNSNKNSRLLFYRNSYFTYILSKGYDAVIKTLIIQSLENDGYIEEAKRLKLY